jgi:hypothetical protein
MRLEAFDFAYSSITARAASRTSGAREKGPQPSWRATRAQIEGQNERAQPIFDRVPADSAGALEVGFAVPTTPAKSCSAIWHSRGGRLAVTGPGGRRRYAELCADAARFGNALLSLG